MEPSCSSLDSTLSSLSARVTVIADGADGDGMGCGAWCGVGGGEGGRRNKRTGWMYRLARCPPALARPRSRRVAAGTWRQSG